MNGGKVVWVEVRTVVANPESSILYCFNLKLKVKQVPLQDTTSGDAQLRVEGSNKVIPGQVLKLFKNC